MSKNKVFAYIELATKMTKRKVIQMDDLIRSGLPTRPESIQWVVVSLRLLSMLDIQYEDN